MVQSNCLLFMIAMWFYLFSVYGSIDASRNVIAWENGFSGFHAFDQRFGCEKISEVIPINNNIMGNIAKY